jgi:hypothetical protein
MKSLVVQYYLSSFVNTTTVLCTKYVLCLSQDVLTCVPSSGHISIKCLELYSNLTTQNNLVVRCLPIPIFYKDSFSK